MRINEIRFFECLNTRRIAVAEFVDRLVRVAYECDMHAMRSEPRKDLQIERIAILAFVHHDFVETRRQCAA